MEKEPLYPPSFNFFHKKELISESGSLRKNLICCGILITLFISLSTLFAQLHNEEEILKQKEKSEFDFMFKIENLSLKNNTIDNLQKKLTKEIETDPQNLKIQTSEIDFQFTKNFSRLPTPVLVKVMKTSEGTQFEFKDMDSLVVSMLEGTLYNKKLACKDGPCIKTILEEKTGQRTSTLHVTMEN